MISNSRGSLSLSLSLSLLFFFYITRSVRLAETGGSVCVTKFFFSGYFRSFDSYVASIVSRGCD